MNLTLLAQRFESLFNHQPEATYFSPGRINLIGEHIDYNGGFVFPCAITIGTYGLISKRSDQLFRIYSTNFDSLGIIEFSLECLEYQSSHNWGNYLKGVIKFLKERFPEISHGFNLVIEGNIPNGSGLSSSASLEILTAKICNDLYYLNLTPIDMALIGKRVENEYIGVNSGIMDQFAIALGKKNTALLLDCATQDYQYIPFELNGYSLIIMNTNKRRELADSKYNERCEECATALKELQTTYPISSLCELKVEDLENAKTLISNPIGFKRVRHAVTEQSRVILATHALRNQDLVQLGQLLNASHSSLKDDYEVSGKELDTLVESAWKQSGVLGARMTGAGFGGCAIALVKDAYIDSFISEVGTEYKGVIGYDASFYIASIGDGPIKLA